MGVKKRSREHMNWVTIVWIEVPPTFYLPHKQYLGWVFLNHKWLPDFSIPQSYLWFFVCKTNVGYFLVLVYCSVRWVFVNFFLYLMANIYMCTYTYVGKIPICHSFLGCLGIFDFSHRSRNPFDNFMSSAGQYNRGSFEIRLKK